MRALLAVTFALILLYPLYFIGGAYAGGYDQPVVFTDGPIIYGTGMNDDDRHTAWKRFFMLMLTTCGKQQGMDALDAGMRCLPNRGGVCSMSIDAMLTEIAGIEEPRKVIVTVYTQGEDQQAVGTYCLYAIRSRSTVLPELGHGELVNPAASNATGLTRVNPLLPGGQRPFDVPLFVLPCSAT